MQSCTYETGATWFQPLKPTNTPYWRLLMLFALLMFLSPIYGSDLSRTWITRTTSQLVLTCSAFLLKHLYFYCSLKRGQIQSNYSISTPRRCSGTLNLTLGAGHYRGQEGTASCVLQLTSHFLSPQLHAPYKAKERAWLFWTVALLKLLLFQKRFWWRALDSKVSLKILRPIVSGKQNGYSKKTGRMVQGLYQNHGLRSCPFSQQEPGNLG